MVRAACSPLPPPSLSLSLSPSLSPPIYYYIGISFFLTRHPAYPQINNAPPDVWVVLNMYQNYNEKSVLINNWMDIFARKYPQVKFVKIIATKCVENFPDSSVPTLIIYKEGKNVSNMPNIDRFLPKLHQTEFEKFLHLQRVIRNPDFEEWEDEVREQRNYLKNPYKQSNTDHMDPVDDREFTSDKIKQHKEI